MSLTTTNSVVSKVLLAKRLKGIGFPKKGIFTVLLKKGKFDGFLHKYENPLNDIIFDIEEDLKKFAKTNKQLILKEELENLETKKKKELEKVKQELEKAKEELKKDPVEDKFEESDESDNELGYEEITESEKYQAEIDFLKDQLEDKTQEIKKLKKMNFSLKAKLKKIKCSVCSK